MFFKKKLNNRIELLSEEQLSKFIDANTEIVIVAPWNGEPLPVVIRMLDSVALASCGEFNTISSVVAEDNKKVDLENIVATKNIHENILKLALVEPNFKYFEEQLTNKDFYKQAKNEIKEIEALIKQLPTEVEREIYRQKLQTLELSIAFILPEDFTEFIINILMQRRATDADKLTKQTLLQAGFLAEKYNTRPCEFLSGIFTEKQRVDIDMTAFALVVDYRESQKAEKEGMRWIRGK